MMHFAFPNRHSTPFKIASTAPSRMLVMLAVVIAAGATPPMPLHATDGKSPAVEYNRDVRPILADACFACHGPDSASRKAGLRLDQREAALEMSAFITGDAAGSELIRRLKSTDPDEKMPPPETKKTLTPEQIETIATWINQGAVYEPHWSFIRPAKIEPPQVSNPSFVQNPIDRFVLRQLQDAGLTPAPPADRRTLARRVSLDLTGLPPSPESVERFVNDRSPDAYEKLVDSLLNSDAWGEHRGRYWLDYARYADTHGIHFDNYREMWSYRDWVIEAFNSNMPYSQFTIENLAGDLLPNATLDQRIASGFNRCNMTTNEGGIIDEEYLVLYARDRTDTTAQVWMGLTAGCAVCHTHKFDPISQREFYEMAAFFNNTTQAAKDGNIKDTPPIIVVPQEKDREAWETTQRLLQDAQTALESRRKEARSEFDTWLASAKIDEITSGIPVQELILHAPLDQQGTTTRIEVNSEPRDVAVLSGVEWVEGRTGKQAAQISKSGIAELSDVGDFPATQPFTVSAWIKTPANDGSGAIVARMDESKEHRGWDLWMEGRRIGTHIIDSWPENALKVVSRNQVPANTWVHVAVSYDGKKKPGGVKIYFNGEEQKTNVAADKLKGETHTDVPFKIGQRSQGALATGVALNDLRIYTASLSPADVKSLASATLLATTLNKPAESRSAEELNSLYDWWLNAKDKTFQNSTALVGDLQNQVDQLKNRGTIAHVMQEKSDEAMAYILNRGEYDQRLDPVKPGTPAFLPPFPESLPRNRLGFAQWLLLPEHPLTARVTVNRFWQEVFGIGLVKSSGDFGVMGEIPLHQDLLDWLAIDFIESGWDVKRLFKMIVMSGTYQQSAQITSQKRELDPENRLLSRGPRFRMDAEMVRDYALASSGKLVQKLGGPSLKPYQPDGVWEVVGMMGSTTRNYSRDTGEALYRRSLYTFVKRMAPPASLEIFNAPNREYCVVRRERTNTPLQALVTLNDEQFVEAARALAQLAIQTAGPGIDDRIQVITLRLLSRNLQPRELAVVNESLAKLQQYYESHPEDAAKLIHFGESKPDEAIPAAELAAWTMLTNELMNLDEVLNK